VTVTPQLTPTALRTRPSREGANIRTWIGFKHFIYLVEQAVLEWVRDNGASVRDLYLDRGLCLEIVDCSVQLPAVLELDDEVRVDVEAEGSGRLVVRIAVRRGERDVTVLRGKVRVALVPDPRAASYQPAPAGLALPEVADLAAACTVGEPGHRRIEPGATVATTLAPAYLWSWRVPYFYCHFSDRVPLSGYVRTMEDVVDRFLADRGISVGRLLAERFWIPVVSRARIRLIGPAHLEETVHTVFTVTDILRGVLFDGRMDCYVRRGDDLVAVATGTILHGYAIAAGPAAGTLAELDDEIVRALRGERP
jgi:acyl-CoA thioesterase FadM